MIARTKEFLKGNWPLILLGPVFIFFVVWGGVYAVVGATETAATRALGALMVLTTCAGLAYLFRFAEPKARVRLSEFADVHKPGGFIFTRTVLDHDAGLRPGPKIAAQLLLSAIAVIGMTRWLLLDQGANHNLLFCFLLIFAGVGGLAPYAVMELDPALRAYRTRQGFFPFRSQTQGSFDELGVLNFIKQDREGEDGIRTLWAIEMTWKESSLKIFTLAHVWAVGIESEEDRELQAYRLCQELAALLGVAIADHTVLEPVLRGASEERTSKPPGS